MSALIKVTEVEIDKNLYSLKRNSKFIVIPYIKSFNDSVVDTEALATSYHFKEFNINEDDLTERELKYGVLIKFFSVEYTDISSDRTKYIHFEKKEDAENFLKELKSCINDFYKNADAYIKYLN